MSILDRFLGRARDASPAVRVEPTISAAETSGVSRPERWLQEIGWGGASRVQSLPRVTPTFAERHATVFACGNNIAGDHAKVPLRLFEVSPQGNAVEVKDHPAVYLLNVEAAPGVPAAVVRFALAYSFAIRGVAYAYGPRDGAGDLELIDLVQTDYCQVLRNGRERFYDFEDGGEVRRRVPSRSMVHLRYMALDGWTHRSPLQVAAESMGLALAGQEAAARTAAGGTTKGFIKLRDDYEDDETRTRSAERIKAALMTGDDWPVLNEGEDAVNLGLSAADQELLQSRKFDREMIAAIYRMPPSKLQMLEYGVKANGQQQAIDYRSDCLLHWAGLIEPQYNQTLLTAAERRRGMFFRHDFDALLEPTTAELYAALKTAVGGPFMTPNDAQRRANLAVTEGGGQLYPPSNMTRDPAQGSTQKGTQDE